MDTSIEFDGIVSPSCIRHLISTFIKHVLYQRGQIPFHFDALKDYLKVPVSCLNQVEQANTSGENAFQCTKDIHDHQQKMRENIKHARKMRKKSRDDEKLRRRIQTFLTSYDACDKHLSDVLDSRSWETGLQVALLLGGSTVSPKEVYVLHFPGTEVAFEQHPRKVLHRRGVVQLFRTLVTSSQLLELTSRQLSPTNLHLLVHTAPGRPELVPRPEQAFRRGKVIHIRLQHSAAALATPAPAPAPAPARAAVSPCCGRAPPRRLQACCARYAQEMGLALLDASLDASTASLDASTASLDATPAAGAEGAGRCGSVVSVSVSSETSAETVGETETSTDASETAVMLGCEEDAEREEEEGEEPVPAAMWCQIPVTVRGFRAPQRRASSEGWVASTE